MIGYIIDFGTNIIVVSGYEYFAKNLWTIFLEWDYCITKFMNYRPIICYNVISLFLLTTIFFLNESFLREICSY